MVLVCKHNSPREQYILSRHLTLYMALCIHILVKQLGYSVLIKIYYEHVCRVRVYFVTAIPELLTVKTMVDNTV